MRLKCSNCGSVNIKTDPGDGTARCIHCHSEEIQVILDSGSDLSNITIYNKEKRQISSYEIYYNPHYR